MHTRYSVLDNGTEVLLAASDAPHVVALQVWVKSGSMAELPAQSGMAHFVEHMLFKGTEARKVGDFSRIIESCGGSIDAYTSYDRTVYHLTILYEHIDVGLELLYDAIYHSAFAAQEIEREKAVVCEEISKYADDPASVTGEEAMRLAFHGKVLPILGRSAQTVRNYQADALCEFYRQHYVPANIAVVAVGNFDLTAELERIGKVFGKANPAPAPQHSRVPMPFTTTSQVAIVRGDFQMPRISVALPAPTATDIDAVSFEIAAHALGAGESSRLVCRLRDELALIAAVSTSYSSVPTWGMLELALLAKEENICATLTALHACLWEMQGNKPITADEIKRAVINSKADFAQQCEAVESLAATLGYGLMTEQKYLHVEHSFALLESMTPQIATEVMQRRDILSCPVIVCALPQQTQLQERELLAAFSSQQSKPKPLPTTTVRHSSDLGFSELQPNFIYRQQNNAKLCNVVIVAKGGLSAETSANNGVFNAIACMLGQATKAHPHRQLMREIEGRGAMLGGFSGKDSIGMQMQCLAADTEYFCQLLVECLSEPVFAEQQWRVVADEISASICLQAENPASVCMQRWQEKIFVRHPYRFPLIGKSLIDCDATELKRLYLSHVERSGWVIAASSPMPSAQMQAQLEALNFSSMSSEAESLSHDAIQAGCYRFPMEREQCHVIHGFKGMSWHDADRPVLDVLISIMDGLGGRLFMQLREEQGLAYAVSPVLFYGIAGGAFGIYAACAPEKTSTVCEVITAELLFGREVSAEELERAKKYIIGNYQLEMASSEKHTMHLALMHLFGVGHDEDYIGKVAAVGKADIDRVIARLISAQPSAMVCVGACG